MAVSLVVLMALVAGASAVQYSKNFPYCPCQAQTKGQTYNWKKTSTKTVSGGTRYCYSVTTYEVPGSPQCTNYDLRKIELDTVTSCASYMKDITFNGETLARSNEFTPYGTITKITRGKGLDLATFQQMVKGPVEVCYTLFGACDTEEKFCVGGVCNVAFFDRYNKCCPQASHYSPPPPPQTSASRPPPATPVSASSFPYCPCDRTTQGPYSITYTKATKTQTGTVYCYEVSAETQSAGKYCSSYDLRKIEFDISLECRGAAKELSYDNQSLAPSFQLFGPPVNGLVFKVGRKDSAKNPLGTESAMTGKKIPLCFTLPDGPCGTLPKFCRDGKTCRVAFFSPNNKCCSTN